MGTRINVAKSSEDPTKKCHCGKSLPCPDHTGDDGDTAEVHNPIKDDPTNWHTKN